MRQTNTRTVAEQKPLGVIDVVSAGLALVWRRPWTLIVPLLFDALIWVLPRLSLTQLFLPFQSAVMSMMAFTADPSSQETQERLQEAFSSIHLLGVATAALNAVTRLPSLLAVNVTAVTSPIAGWNTVMQIQSPEWAAFLFIPIFLLGLLAVSVYLELIAQGVRPLQAGARGAGFLRIAKLWLNLILFTLILIGLVMVALVFVVAVRIVFDSPELGAFATLVASVGIFWLLIYYFFVPGIMSVSGVGFAEALRRSSLLFRIFFWHTLALVALSVFLDQGLTLLWSGLTVSTLGIALGIAANAFIGTSLLAASMVYYQDRMNLLERMRAQVKPKK